MRNDNFRLSILLALGVGVVSAAATDLKYFQTFQNVDYASAGVGGLRQVGFGTIQLTGVSGTILHAYLYWHGLEQASDPETNSATVLFNNVLVKGDWIGTSGADGWDGKSDNTGRVFQRSQAFRADVTSQVTGSGAYQLSKFVPFGGDEFQPIATVQGASLLVIYDDGNSANNHDIVIEDGCDQNSDNIYDAPGWNISFPGVNYTPGDQVEMEFHVSDGQAQYLEGGIYLNGQLLAPTNGIQIDPNTGKAYGQIFAGTAPYASNSGFPYSFFTGSLWDINKFNIVPLLSPGVNNLYITSDNKDDALTVIALVAKFKSGTAVVPSLSSLFSPPPTINCGGAAVYAIPFGSVAASTSTQATVSDPNGAALTVTWRINNVLVQQDTIPAGSAQTPTVLSLNRVLAAGHYTLDVIGQDSSGQSASCSTAFDVVAPTVSYIIQAPRANADTASTQIGVPVNIDVLANDSDYNKPALPIFISSFTQPPPGTGTVTPGITGLLYTPAPGFYGLAAFSYTISNGKGTATAVVAVRVIAPQISPTAVNAAATTVAGQSVTLNVLANDSDPNGYPLTVIAVGSPTLRGGSVVINNDGSVTYFPPPGFTGIDTFAYTISDGHLTASATVTITITAPPPPPGSYTTFTQGGWGAPPNGSNPGALLANNFSKIYPAGIVIGMPGVSGLYSLTFDKSTAVSAFLPQGGTPAALKASALDPNNKISVFAGQVLALKLNLDFSNAGIKKTGLGNLILASGKLAGFKVSDVLSICNYALSGYPMTTLCQSIKASVTISDLNDIAALINQNFDNGSVNGGYLLGKS